MCNDNFLYKNLYYQRKIKKMLDQNVALWHDMVLHNWHGSWLHSNTWAKFILYKIFAKLFS